VKKSDEFPIQNGLKQGDALSQSLFNFASVYAIKKVLENEEGLGYNEIHQLLIYVDDVNILDENTNAKTKIIEALLKASREVGLEVSIEKTKYMSVSRQQYTGHNENVLIANESF
jgi:hypothetical protein